ncbi:MAG: hypothetical protein JO170_15905 [Verrucomicrobia bacterium]|nr:hypothetical protein [Verrucomicrobiota bacterium]
MKVRDAFAWPFKVLGDVFTHHPLVPDPEFTGFDLKALRGEDTGVSNDVSNRQKSTRASRKRVRIPILLLALVLIVVALIILG